MKKKKVKATYEYEIEIDENNEIVKDYENENDLIVDCASYRFSDVLPVIRHRGVKINNIELVEVH